MPASFASTDPESENRSHANPSRFSRVKNRSSEMSADRLWIETLDDLLAFEALRLTVGGARERQTDAPVRWGDAFEVFGGPAASVDNDWLVCPGFLIRRLNDAVTMEGRQGGDDRHAG